MLVGNKPVICNRSSCTVLHDLWDHVLCIADDVLLSFIVCFCDTLTSICAATVSAAPAGITLRTIGLGQIATQHDSVPD